MKKTEADPSTSVAFAQDDSQTVIPNEREESSPVASNDSIGSFDTPLSAAAQDDSPTCHVERKERQRMESKHLSLF